MKSLTVGELKSSFSAVLDRVIAGETIVICYGRSHRQVAAIVPIESLTQAKKRTLGILQGKAKARFADDFGIDDETLFSV